MGTKFRVLVEARARVELLERGSWWLENRPKNPLLFEEEFEAVITFLEHNPRTLRVLMDVGRAGVRRKLMPRTRHHVYYAGPGPGPGPGPGLGAGLGPDDAHGHVHVHVHVTLAS